MTGRPKLWRARAFEGAVAANDDEAVDAMLGEDVEGAFLRFFLVEIGATAGLEKGAGVANAARDDVVVEVDEFVIEDALVSVADAMIWRPLVRQVRVTERMAGFMPGSRRRR